MHIIMYTYYLFAAMGPQYQKFLWWKKYITNMQMVSLNIPLTSAIHNSSNFFFFFPQIQFCLAFLHSAQLVYTDCGYPRWSVFFTLPNAIFFYFLFNDFYQKSYKPTDKVMNSPKVVAVPTTEKPVDSITSKCAEFEDDTYNNNGSIAKLNINNNMLSETAKKVD